MTDNILKIRIKHRIDTAANWENCTEPPLNGELIIYKAEQGAPAQFKIGDGINTASNLPFITEGLATENYVDEKIANHSALPEGASAHQMLVTDTEGNKVWEDRTHYIETIEILPETEISGTEESRDEWALTVPFTQKLTVGYPYTVTWNGVEYTGIVQNREIDGISFAVLGNMSLFGDSEEDNGHPYGIVVVPDEQVEALGGLYAVISPVDISVTSATIGISSVAYHRLPYEYLPEDLYRTERGETILLPTNTPTLTDDGYAINVPLKQELVLGETYTVIWNGVAYECEYKSLTETIEDGAVVNANFLGTESTFGLPSTSDVPFTIILYMTIGGINMMPEGVYGMCMPTDETTEITLSISGMSEVVYKVPDKYLPPKTHWVNEEDKIILPETTFTGLSSGGTGVNANLNYDLEVGVQYTVVWNGTEYTSTAQVPLYSGINVAKMILGNGEAFGLALEDVPYCFAVLTSEGAQVVGHPYFLASTYDAEATMKIIEPAGTVHKLDKKYLPDITAEDVGAVPETRTINGKALNMNIILTASDVGALPATTQIPSVDGLASKTYVDEKVADLVDSSPETLNTLNELAAALGDDPNFATTVTNKLGELETKIESIDYNDVGAEPAGAVAALNIANGIGIFSIVEGINTIANDYASHAEGNVTAASGPYSHAEGTGAGFKLTLSGEANATTYIYTDPLTPIVGSIVKYNNVNASITSVDINDNNETTITLDKTLSSETLNNVEVVHYTLVASGQASHAEGYATIASGGSSHAEGIFSRAEGEASHAEGYQVTAKGEASHAEGFLTRASSDYQHVQGKYNIEDTANKYVHIVGNGTSTKRSNAHTLDWNGNAWYQGDVFIGGTSQDDANKLATETYVDEKVADLSINSSVDSVNGKTGTVVLSANDVGAEPAGAVAALNLENGAGIGSIQMGRTAQANAIDSHAEGSHTFVCGSSSHAEGSGEILTKIFISGEANANTFIISNSTSSLAKKYLVSGRVIKFNEKIGYILEVNDTTIVLDRALSNSELIETEVELFGLVAYGSYSHAEGHCTISKGSSSHAEGRETIANGNSSHAEGRNTTTNGNFSHAEGSYTIVNGDSSHAEGYQTISKGEASHTEGRDTIANGYYSHAEGRETIANGNSSHAEGRNTIANGDYSHAEGRGLNATIIISGAANATTYTINKNSGYLKIGAVISINNVYGVIKNITDNIFEVDTTLSSEELIEASAKIITFADGEYSHVEGCYTTAIGENSHAEGYLTTAAEVNSHAEGYETITNGHSSHAEGNNTIANGKASHAEGLETIANGDFSHAEGSNTIASGTRQHVQGKYNIEDTDGLYAHIVGNGVANTRSNAHTLDWEGNAWYAGNVYVGSTSGTNKDEGSKKVATEDYVNAQIQEAVKNFITQAQMEAYVNESILGGAW